MHKTGINQSQVTAFAGCRWKWMLQYQHNLVPRVTRPKMYLGTMVHVGLDATIRASLQELPCHPSDVGEMAIQKKVMEYFDQHDLFDEEKEFTLEEAKKATVLVDRAWHHFAEHYEVVTLDGEPMVEFRVVAPIEGNPLFDHFHGTIDAVVREKDTGRLYVLDHKVRTQLQPVEDEEVNIQMGLYQGVLVREYNLPVVGSICHQIFNELPKQPKLNKDGSMSRSDIKTDWPTYKAALVGAGLDPEDYTDMATKLKDKEFFRISKAYRNAIELDALWEHFLRIAEEIASYNVLYRNLNAWNCKGCQYRDLCLEDMRGGDTEYIIENEYMVKVSAEEDQGEVAGT